jgi:hypothetical protein
MGIKISEMTTTGSAPADSYIPLAHNGENYKVAPSNVGGFSGGLGVTTHQFNTGNGPEFSYSLPSGRRTMIFLWAPAVHAATLLLIVDEGTQTFALQGWGEPSNGFQGLSNNTPIPTTTTVISTNWSTDPQPKTIHFHGDGAENIYLNVKQNFGSVWTVFATAIDL